MRTCQAIVVAALIIGLAGGGTASSAAGKAKLRRAKKILADIKRVDGPGSGLDADTVRGLKPLVVLDANGKFVGALLDLPGNDGALVIRRFGDVSVRMSVSENGLRQ